MTISTELRSVNWSNIFNTTHSSEPTQELIRLSIAIRITFCIIFSIISTGVVLGNVTAASLFLRKRKLHTRAVYFLMSLAFSDIIVGSVGIPSFIYILANSVEFPNFVYTLWNAIDVFGATASIWYLMMISIERFYAVGWPFLHRVSSKRPYFCLIVLVWSISVALSCITVTEASRWPHYTLFVSMVSFVLPLTVILFVYLAMFFIALKSVRLNTRQTQSAEKDTRLAKAILLIIGCFIVAWAPFFGLNFAYWACHSCVDIEYELILVFKVLQYSSSLANPIIYTLRIPGCYQAFVELCGHWLRCQKTNYLENPEYPLTPNEDIALVRFRHIDNPPFHCFSLLVNSADPLMKSSTSGSKGKTSRPFCKSKNLTFTSMV